MLETYHHSIDAMKPAIEQLLTNYDGFGNHNEIETAELPHIELKNFLAELDLYYPGARKRKLKLAIRHFITQLSCFHYRVIAKSEKQTIAVWNPLEKTLKNFISEHNKHNIVYHDNKHPYPTEDIISDWVTSHIKEDIASD